MGARAHQRRSAPNQRCAMSTLALSNATCQIGCHGASARPSVTEACERACAPWSRCPRMVVHRAQASSTVRLATRTCAQTVRPVKTMLIASFRHGARGERAATHAATRARSTARAKCFSPSSVMVRNARPASREAARATFTTAPSIVKSVLGRHGAIVPPFVVVARVLELARSPFPLRSMVPIVPPSPNQAHAIPNAVPLIAPFLHGLHSAAATRHAVGACRSARDQSSQHLSVVARHALRCRVRRRAMSKRALSRAL